MSRRSCRDSNPEPFDHESDALTTELSPLPGDYYLLFIRYSKSYLRDFDIKHLDRSPGREIHSSRVALRILPSQREAKRRSITCAVDRIMMMMMIAFICWVFLFLFFVFPALEQTHCSTNEIIVRLADGRMTIHCICSLSRINFCLNQHVSAIACDIQ